MIDLVLNSTAKCFSVYIIATVFTPRLGMFHTCYFLFPSKCCYLWSSNTRQWGDW